MKSIGLRGTALAVTMTFCLQTQAQNAPPPSGVVGTWHLVRIDSPGPSPAAQPNGILIYTPDHHAAVQLMYPDAALSNEFVHDGYEATFGTYDVDAVSHQLTYHVQGSATREKLVGKSETLQFDFPDPHHTT